MSAFGLPKDEVQGRAIHNAMFFANKKLLRIVTIVIAIMVAFSMVAFYSLLLF